MKVWAKTEEFSEGKFLVVRRDGSVPHWPHFVIGARDPAAPEALRGYADVCERLGFEAEYVASVRELAGDFYNYRRNRRRREKVLLLHSHDLPMVAEVVEPIRRAIAAADAAASAAPSRS
jgi:hypothetical protein